MEPHYYCNEAGYTPTAFENGYQPTKVPHPYPGQYCIDKTTMGFSIRRGGPPLFDGPFEMDHFKRRMNHTEEEEKYKIELAINRDSLLGACLQAHTATVPLYTMLDIGSFAYPTGSVVIHCTFALSREQIESPPLSLDPISGYGKIPIKDLKGTENQYVDCIKTVMDGIVHPATQPMQFAHVEFIYSFNSPGGLTTLECSYEAVYESTEEYESTTTGSIVEANVGGDLGDPAAKRARNV